MAQHHRTGSSGFVITQFQPRQDSSETHIQRCEFHAVRAMLQNRVEHGRQFPHAGDGSHILGLSNTTQALIDRPFPI